MISPESNTKSPESSRSFEIYQKKTIPTLHTNLICLKCLVIGRNYKLIVFLHILDFLRETKCTFWHAIVYIVLKKKIHRKHIIYQHK